MHAGRREGGHKRSRSENGQAMLQTAASIFGVKR